MRWLELVLEVPPQNAEAVAAVIQPFCYGGVALEPAIATAPGSEAFTLAQDRPTAIKAYLTMSRGLGMKRKRLLDRLHETCGDVAVLEREVREEDWATAWKSYFKTLRVGKRLVVKPSWQSYRIRPGDVVVELDPGMAFGTGDHPTTRACLSALERVLLPGMSVLDLGTGSGILAIAAAKLGAEAVLALDIDPLAVKAAQENCSLNQVADKVTVQLGSLDRVRKAGWKQADLILANLTSLLHCELASQMLSLLASGGNVVASGIGAPALRAVTAAYRKAGAERVAISRQGEWRTLLIR